MEESSESEVEANQDTDESDMEGAMSYNNEQNSDAEVRTVRMVPSSFIRKRIPRSASKSQKTETEREKDRVWKKAILDDERQYLAYMIKGKPYEDKNYQSIKTNMATPYNDSPGSSRQILFRHEYLIRGRRYRPISDDCCAHIQATRRQAEDMTEEERFAYKMAIWQMVDN